MSSKISNLFVTITIWSERAGITTEIEAALAGKIPIVLIKRSRLNYSENCALT